MNVLRTWLQQVWCIHAYLRTAERHCIFLHCTKCGHNTPGWAVEPRKSTEHLWET